MGACGHTGEWVEEAMEQVLEDWQEGASAAADGVLGIYAVVDASGSTPTSVFSMPATGEHKLHSAVSGQFAIGHQYQVPVTPIGAPPPGPL